MICFWIRKNVSNFFPISQHVCGSAAAHWLPWNMFVYLDLFLPQFMHPPTAVHTSSLLPYTDWCPFFRFKIVKSQLVRDTTGGGFVDGWSRDNSTSMKWRRRCAAAQPQPKHYVFRFEGPFSQENKKYL